MSSPPQDKPSVPLENLREIAKWASRYAKSRTIPFLVQWTFIVLLGVAIAGAAYMTMRAYGTGNVGWLLLCAAGIVGTIMALMWFVVPRWGGDQIYRISQWVYGEEGYAAYWGGDAAEDLRADRWVYVAALGLAFWHLAGAVLVTSRHLDLSYMQPFSAVYMTPFLIAMTYSQRLGFWAYIWPALYGLHAVLTIAGAPIRFTNVNLVILNMIVPIFGYGLVAIIVGHVYSRYAFRKLRKLVQKGLDLTQESTEETAGPED